MDSYVVEEAVGRFREVLPDMTDNKVPNVSHGMHPQYVEAMTPYLMDSLRNILGDLSAFPDAPHAPAAGAN